MKSVHIVLVRYLNKGAYMTFGIVCLAFFILGCASKPVLTGLDPSSGPVGTVVEVQGERLNVAGVRWDANTASEQGLPTNFLAARFFTVPLSASTGPHPVRLFGDGQYSDNTVNFTVTQGIVRPRPRVDDVTVDLFSINSSGEATMILMVHGANIDVGSEILISNATMAQTTQTTSFSRLLRNTSMNATLPATLGYPIFHYATVWTILDNQTPGRTLRVSVKNLDGEVSNVLTYRIAANMDELDSDGDGLPDIWEKNGYDADGDGVVDVDLPTLGATPLRKDLFIEVDWMSEAPPNNAIWAAMEDSFTNAPILNSDGSQGIAIHIDRGQAGAGGGGGDDIPYADRIRYDNGSSPGATFTNFYTVKQNNFNNDRLNIYRYCVFAWDSGHFPGSSGRAEGFTANDFFVTLGAFANGQRADFQTGTFMHELGHTLNLRHGGFENTNSKDNYNSIMQYGNEWITWNMQDNIYSPNQFGGIDVDCNMLDVDGVYTYSQGQRRDLNESNLDENVGVCDNIARDWNGNGINTEASVSVNLDTNTALTTIKDNADWANIELNFRAPGSDWNNN